jgi:hypothetical protein
MIDGKDVCCQQETEGAVDEKFDRQQLPTRDNGNERQQQETVDGRDS